MKSKQHRYTNRWAKTVTLVMSITFFLPFCLQSQTLSKVQGKRLLDSLLQSSGKIAYEISRISPLEYNFQLLRADINIDCDKRNCRKVRKSIITPKGDTLAPIFTDIVQFSTGNIVLINDFKSFQVTPNMKVMKVYDQFNDFENGLAVFVEDGRYGICNGAGSVLLKPSYDYLGAADNLNRIPAKNEGKWTILERKGNKITPQFSSDTTQINKKGPALKAIKIQNPQTRLWAILDDKAQQVTPYKYQAVIPFSGGTTIGQVNYLWGLIAYDGQELSEFIYEKIYKSYGTNYMVSVGDTSPKFGLISDKGEELIPISYRQISKEPLHSDRIKGLYWVVEESNNLWGLLNLEGQPLTGMNYEKINVSDYDNPKGLSDGKWIELLKK